MDAAEVVFFLNVTVTCTDSYTDCRPHLQVLTTELPDTEPEDSHYLMTEAMNMLKLLMQQGLYRVVHFEQHVRSNYCQ